MTYIEALRKLLLEYERQAKYPKLWYDTTWKEIYFTLFNKVYDALNKLDKEELAK